MLDSGTSPALPVNAFFRMWHGLTCSHPPVCRREDTERHLHVMPSTLPSDGRAGGGGSPTKVPSSFLG